MYLCITFLGASFGSFAGVLIYRLPKEMSLLKSSSCNNCNKNIAYRHNLPLFGYLFLKGKCAYCKSSIGLRYFLLEIIFALAILSFYKKYGLSFTFIHHLVAFSILVVIAYIDLDTMFIPNILLLSLIILGLLGAIILHTPLWPGFLGFSFIALLNITFTLIYRKKKRIGPKDWAMGWGDAWLVLGIGFFTGFPNIFFVIFLAAFLGSMTGLLKKMEMIPFGAFLGLFGILFLNFSL